MEQIKCPECGEMYSSTYKRCPFCEEDGDGARKISYRPTRHITDRHKGLSARGGLIVVLVLVLGLLGWYFFGGNTAKGNKPGGSVSATDKPATSDGQPAVPASSQNGASSDPFYQPPDDTSSADTSSAEPSVPAEGGETATAPVEPQPTAEENVDVSGAALNREDFTLSGVGDSYRVKLTGTEATPHWSIDNANVASLSADGTVTAVANGRTTLRCKVGSRELTCIVRVNNTGRTAEPADAPTSAEPVTPTAPTSPATSGSTGSQTAAQPTTTPTTPTTTTPTTPSASATHVDASSLSVKTNYGTTLQKDPDTGYPDCTVRIGGDPIALRIAGTDVPVSSWTSDNTSVVEVSADGKLTPVSKGTAHVTARVGDAEIICIIRVR